MLTQEQAIKIKQLAFNCVEAVAIYVSKASVTSKLAAIQAKKEFDEYLKEITLE